jgi:PAS domain S-box-containing protein
MISDYLRAAFDDSYIAQIVISPNGEAIAINDQACRMLGFSREDFMTMRHDDMALDTDVGALDGLVDKFNADNLQNWQTEQRYVRNDGVVIWGSVNATGIKHDGKAVALLLQIQDITSQKRTEEDLQRNNEDLEQFIHIASHDLREPLTSVAGYASLLKRRYANVLDESGQHFLDEVIKSTQRMEQKIDDLLTFSRAGRAAPLGVFPLGVAIEEARRAVSLRAEECGTLFDIPEDLPIVQGDRSMVAQVFQNLFSNSVKYRSKERLAITVRAQPQEDATWLISVQDNGVGFDMRYKDRIFVVFQRLYTNEEYPGTGIGLAIAKRIVERHRGEIWTESEQGVGSTFFFTLPTVPQP